MTLGQYCREHQQNTLLEEWHLSKNQDCSPEQISYASHRIVWWQCPKGHIWRCGIKERTGRHTGCPYCTGRRPIPGETDLASQYPDIAQEWHPRRNKQLKPEEVTAGSEQKVWWQCSLGHEWQATIENRALKGNKCPYCTGRKAWPGYNDFATLYPDLMKEWHPKLNGSLDPSKIRPGAKKRVYWQCSEGHVWDTWIFSRTSKKRPGCPVCAGRVQMEAGLQKDYHVRRAETTIYPAEYTQMDNSGIAKQPTGGFTEEIQTDNFRKAPKPRCSLPEIPAATSGQESRYHP